MRLFVASSFEPAFAANLGAVAERARLGAGGEAVKWVPPSNFHITYAFLGDLDQQGAAAAQRGIGAGITGVGSFKIISGSLGVFPSLLRPAVLWVGIGEGADRLRDLSARLAEGLAAQGLSCGNSFEPHVTLGRVKRRLPENFLRLAGEFAAGGRAASLISSVELMESRLTPAGPVYSRVYSGKLEGAV